MKHLDINSRLEARQTDKFPQFPGVKGWYIWDKKDNDWCKEGIQGPFWTKKKCDDAIAHIVDYYSNMNVHVN